MKKTIAFLLLGFAFGGCGGGGGGGGANGDAADPREEIARQILAACSRDAFGEYLDVLRAFHDITQLSTPTQITYVAVAGANNDVVSIEFDLDGAPGAEFLGTLRFLDADDATVLPIDLQTLVDGTSLLDALTGVGASIRLLLNFTSAGTGNITGQLFATIDSGIATQVRGNFTILVGDGCSTTFSLRLTPIANFNGVFPRATSDFSMRRAPDLVVGVVVMDQTVAAPAQVVLNGTSDPFSFFINLQNGTVTLNGGNG